MVKNARFIFIDRERQWLKTLFPIHPAFLCRPLFILTWASVIAYSWVLEYLMANTKEEENPAVKLKQGLLKISKYSNKSFIES